jgi:hypothetical protein
MKIKGNVSILLIITLIIFLGILWWDHSKKIIEGNTDSTTYPSLDMNKSESRAFSAGLMSTVNSALTQAGANPISEGDMTSLFDNLSGIINGEIQAANDAEAAIKAAEDSTPVVNTVPRMFSDNTFFLGDKFGDAFCQIYTNPTELATKCRTLTSENCNATSCCIWVNGSKCVSGSELGPGPMSGMATPDVDYYSYKYQCYGNCPGDYNRPIPEPMPEPIPEPMPEPTPEPTPVPTPVPTTDKRVYGNNGTVSCDRYCAGTGGRSWNNELPASWNGAVCKKAGKNDDQRCDSVAGYSVQGTECLCGRSDNTPWAK